MSLTATGHDGPSPQVFAAYPNTLLPPSFSKDPVHPLGGERLGYVAVRSAAARGFN